MRMAQVQQRILLLQGRAFIQEAWREWVNRPPKMKELKYWQYQLNRGIPKHVMLQKLLRSSQVKALVKAEQPEFSGSSAVRTVHVLNQLFRQSDEEYVGGLYRELLNRNPAPEELQGFISSLVTPDDRWSVFEAITLSPEAQGLWQSRERTWSVASLLNRTFLLNGRRFVGALTRELLARGALQVEIRRFAQLALSPEGKEQVLAALLGSEAFQRALVRRRLPRGQSARGWSIEGLRKLYRLNGTDFVTGLYEELLGRTPDEGGFLLHLQKLQSLSKLDLIRGILLSQEAQLRRREPHQSTYPSGKSVEGGAATLGTNSTKEMNTMKYLVGIPYRNRRDLLLRALESIRIYWPQTIIIDNTEHNELHHDSEVRNMVSVYEPCVPLSFTQSMNLFKKWAEERGCDAVIYMHNDGEAYEGSAQAFLNVLQQLQAEGKRWGLAHTDSLAIVAYSVDAMRVVGEWDVNLPTYFSDIDYHRRLYFAGFESVPTNIQVLHHGSSTVKSDPELNFLNSILFELHHQYYQKKWGGKMGQETFHTPFGR